MNRYTHQDGDAARLPEGIKRVAYDTDTSRYTFRDPKGILYLGEPGSEYGHLTPVLDPIEKTERERPEAFNDSEGKERSIPLSPRLPDEAAPRSFHDMLPAELITSPTTQPDTNPQSSSAFAGLVTALMSPTSARHSEKGGITSPKVQGVMASLKRTMSGANRKKEKGGRDRAASTSNLGSTRALDGSEKANRELPRKGSQESFKSCEKM